MFTIQIGQSQLAASLFGLSTGKKLAVDIDYDIDSMVDTFLRHTLVYMIMF